MIIYLIWFIKYYLINRKIIKVSLNIKLYVKSFESYIYLSFLESLDVG